MLFIKGIEIKKFECVCHYQNLAETRLGNLKEKKRLSAPGCLTDATIDRLQNYVGVAIRQIFRDLRNTKSSFLASLFHIASNNDNMYHYQHSPTGSNSWCKYNADRVSNTQTCIPGPGFPKDIIYKIRPKF